MERGERARGRRRNEEREKEISERKRESEGEWEGGGEGQWEGEIRERKREREGERERLQEIPPVSGAHFARCAFTANRGSDATKRQPLSQIDFKRGFPRERTTALGGCAGRKAVDHPHRPGCWSGGESAGGSSLPFMFSFCFFSSFLPLQWWKWQTNP